MTGRPSYTRRLNVWMNGILVGFWEIHRNRGDAFSYTQEWLDSEFRRPISLSMPLTLGTRPINGDRVSAYFDNLLPDNLELRRKIAVNRGAKTSGIFDLLEMIGRDCVGAVQLLSPDAEPPNVRRIQSRPLTDDEIETRLQSVQNHTDIGTDEGDDFRLSLAGAQDKTALLWHKGRWELPRGSTPTTHIFKLPLGKVGNRGLDLSSSLENEWLCSRIIKAYGLPVAESKIAHFGRAKALIVERFDRIWLEDGSWIARLPQEDFCQVFGLPSNMKYEANGGPSMLAILDMLRGSETAETDRAIFLSAQLLFWMLAATDGHAKNFSIHLRDKDGFGLTPLYDVISTWPVIGKGQNQLPFQKAKMAMAVRSKNAHYLLNSIQRRHWVSMAKQANVGNWSEKVLDQIVERTPTVIQSVQAELPPGFPESVAGPIFEGLERQAKALVG